MSPLGSPAAAARGTLWIISAPSGGGKTSLTRALVDELNRRGAPTEISVSYTTRAARPGEQDGVHYHYVDDARFSAMVERGEFLEHADVFGRRYGTGRDRTAALLAAGTDVLLDIDWQGGRQIRAQQAAGAAFDAVGIFIVPPSLDELERRLRARAQDDDAVIARRMREARDEIAHYGEYDYLIVNRDFEVALAEMLAIVSAQRLRTPTQRQREQAVIVDLLGGA